MSVCASVYLFIYHSCLTTYLPTSLLTSLLRSFSVGLSAFKHSGLYAHIYVPKSVCMSVSPNSSAFSLLASLYDFLHRVCQFAPRYWNMYIFLSLSAVWHFPNQPVLLCCIRVCLFVCMYRNLSVFLSLWAVWHFSNQAVHLLSCLSVWQHDNSHACLFPFLIKPA